jgi:hypothetical protein
MLILTSGVCIAPDPDPDPDRQVSNLGSAMTTEALCGPIEPELGSLPALSGLLVPMVPNASVQPKADSLIRYIRREPVACGRCVPLSPD